MKMKKKKYQIKKALDQLVQRMNVISRYLRLKTIKTILMQFKELKNLLRIKCKKILKL